MSEGDDLAVKFQDMQLGEPLPGISFELLPQHIRNRVFECFDLKSLLAFCGTSKSYNAIGSTDEAWKNAFMVEKVQALLTARKIITFGELDLFTKYLTSMDSGKNL